MTLSSWLRDYLYISLGGNRCSKTRKNFNLMMTMFLGGLWHGANWTFAVWGIYHGALLILFHKIETPWGRLPVIIQRTVTFMLVVVGWIFFRANNFRQAAQWLVRLVGTNGLGVMNAQDWKLAFLVVLGVFITQSFSNASHARNLDELAPPSRIALGIIFSIAILLLSESSRFLYFQF